MYLVISVPSHQSIKIVQNFRGLPGVPRIYQSSRLAGAPIDIGVGEATPSQPNAVLWGQKFQITLEK